MSETTILLVDDHAVLRAGLHMLLDAQPGLRVVGEAGDAQEAMGLAAQLQPDLILLDLTLPQIDGMTALPLAELISAVRAVMRGENYVHPAMTRALLDDLLPATTANSDPWETLSEREREVLVLVARGYTAGEIGAQLSLSPKTVETYRLRGMEKLGMRSRAALVQFALAHNLLAEPSPAR